MTDAEKQKWEERNKKIMELQRRLLMDHGRIGSVLRQLEKLRGDTYEG